MEKLLQVDPTLSGSLPRFSDKTVLPSSYLGEIIDRFGEDTLPHPMIFRATCNDITTYVGVQEFSESRDNIVGLPWVVQQRFLGGEDDESAHLDITFSLVEDIPKATALTLRPVKTYSKKVRDNWKYFLESKLRRFTVLTEGTVLYVEDSQQVYELQIEQVSPAKTVCIIDTDVDLVVNDDGIDQVVETGISVGDTFEVNKENLHPMTIPKAQVIGKYLCLDGDENVDMVVGDRFVSLDRYRWSTMTNREILIEDLDGNDDDDIHLIVFSWGASTKAKVLIRDHSEVLNQHLPHDTSNGVVPDDKVECGNCHQLIPKASNLVHSSFCYRNNIVCSCGKVFLKQIPESHWKCAHCSVHGDNEISQYKHEKLFHSGPYTCTHCNSHEEFSTSMDLATKHGNLECPERLHECRFCHLEVPVEVADFEDNFYGLSHHENYCGNKTVDCPKCGKILRVKDLPKHSQIHELKKAAFNEAVKTDLLTCSNLNCINMVGTNVLGLCDLCYGPLYSSILDPTNFKLQNRIERRYMIQLSRGCGQSWCKNEECKSSGRSQLGSMKETLDHVKDLLTHIYRPSLPLNGPREGGINQFWFCVDQNSTKRKLMVENLHGEEEYPEEMIVKAVNEVKDVNELRIREWLVENALKV